MKDFAGKIAVITGGGTGMGRELARQLVAEGCNVAMCDVSAENMAETKRLCEVEKLPQGLRITTHIADVSIEDQVLRFRDEVAEQQATDKIHLLFNNAGIGGGGSLVTNTREQWDKTFACLLVRRLLQHPRVPADAAEGDRRPHRQHLQRQRLLGVDRPGAAAHRLQRGEVRGEGIYRSADRRSAHERAAHQVLGGDAGTYRHVDRLQHPQDPDRQRVRRFESARSSRRARQRLAASAWMPRRCPTTTSRRCRPSARGASARKRR